MLRFSCVHIKYDYIKRRGLIETPQYFSFHRNILYFTISDVLEKSSIDQCASLAIEIIDNIKNDVQNCCHAVPTQYPD